MKWRFNCQHTQAHHRELLSAWISEQDKSWFAASSCHKRWLLDGAILMVFTCYLHHAPSCHARFPACLICRLYSCVYACVFVLLRLCTHVCFPWCPINPNNRPTVMREMRFPLNNSRPVRFVDLPTSQAGEQTIPCTHTHMHAEGCTLSACINSRANTFKYTHSLHRGGGDDTVSLCCCLFNCLPERTLITEASCLSAPLFHPELNYWIVSEKQLNTDYFSVRGKNSLFSVNALLSLAEMIVITFKRGRVTLNSDPAPH